MKNGFVKVAAASPVIRVADCDYNAGRVIACLREAAEQGVKVLVFPELTEERRKQLANLIGR